MKGRGSMPADVPRSIVIGPYEYRVRLEHIAEVDTRDDSDEGERDVNSMTLGTIEKARLAIIIHPEQAPLRMRDTLLHEVMHGVFDASGLNLDSTEEDVVSAFTTILLDTLRENPGFVSWLLDNE